MPKDFKLYDYQAPIYMCFGDGKFLINNVYLNLKQ